MYASPKQDLNKTHHDKIRRHPPLSSAHDELLIEVAHIVICLLQCILTLPSSSTSNLACGVGIECNCPHNTTPGTAVASIMANDEESRHAPASEETPLLAAIGNGTTASGEQNGSGNDEDMAPTPVAGKRAAVVAFAVVCLLFIQGMITESEGIPHHTDTA